MTNVNRLTAEALGVCVNTVETYMKPNAAAPEGIRTGRPTAYDVEYWCQRVRLVINDMVKAKTKVSIDAVYEQLSAPATVQLLQRLFPMTSDEPLSDDIIQEHTWTLSRATTHRLMLKAGFSFHLRTLQPIEQDQLHNVKECYSMRLARRNFIQRVKQARIEGRVIWYQDETWCNAFHLRKHVWHDSKGRPMAVDPPKGQRIDGGGRIIINHIGSVKGFLDGAKDAFIGKTNSDDYHTEMNWEHWSIWFKEKVLPNVNDRDMIVVDQATYHTKLHPDCIVPNTSSTVDVVTNWLTERNLMDRVTPTHGKRGRIVKDDMLDVVRANKPKRHYLIHDIIKEFNAAKPGRDVQVLMLPVHHCELNPIEMIWAWVKGYVADKNGTPGNTANEGTVLKLSNEGLDQIDVEMWQACYNHVIKIEDKYMEELERLDVEAPLNATDDILDQEEWDAAIDANAVTDSICPDVYEDDE